MIGRRPGPCETCLDLGASPGGWSWALQRMGAHVISVDKAPLAPDIAARTYEQLIDPAFGFTPDAKFDMQGFRNMMALRAEVEGKTMAAPERYLDFSYYDRAMEMVGK